MERDKSGSEMSVKMKLITSCAIWYCNITFGMAANLLSPLLVEVKNKYGTEIDDISKVFTIILASYLVGALTCGLLFNYLNRQLMLVVLFSGIAIGLIVVPYCPTKLSFFVDGACIGFATGGVDTGMLVWMLELWQGQAGVYVHTHYFFFAVGTVIAPLLIKPFLLEEDPQSTTMSTTMMMSTTELSSTVKNVTEESQLYIPLSVGGSLVILGASFLLFLFFVDRYVPPPPRQDLKTSPGISTESVESSVQVGSTDTDQDNPLKKKTDWHKIVLIILSAICLGCYQGMELSTFQFVPTFTHYVDLRLSEPDGASVLAGLTGAYTVGRFSGIFISKVKIAPVLILIGNLVLVIIANMILLLYADTNLTLLWVGSCLLGLGYSTVFASIYDHIEKYLEITNNVGAIMVIMGGLVSALYPLIIGDMVQYHPLVLMYTIFFSVVACSVSFSAIYWITVIRKKQLH